MNVPDYMLVGKLIGAVILMALIVMIYVEYWMNSWAKPHSDEELERRLWGSKYDA
jgi:hypothetical protein